MSKNRIQFGGKEVVLPAKKKSPLHAQTGGWTEKQKEALREARGWYDVWKKEFVSTPCPTDQVAGRVLAFHDQIKKKIKNGKVRRAICELIEYDFIVAKATFGEPQRPSEKAGG